MFCCFPEVQLWHVQVKLMLIYFSKASQVCTEPNNNFVLQGKLLWKCRENCFGNSGPQREFGNHWSVISVPQDGRQDCISALCIIMIAIKFHWNCFVWQIAAFRPQQHTTLWLGSDAEKNFSWWYTNNPVYSLRGRTHPTWCQSWASPPRLRPYQELWLTGQLLWRGVVWRSQAGLYYGGTYFNKIYSRESSCP